MTLFINLKNMVKSKECSWEEYKYEIAKNKQSWVYRGQPDSSWELESSLERYNFDSDVETQLLNEFKGGFELFVEKEIKYDLDYLAYMQHYGVPTRLLDFTYSPYIAAYFAFENPQNENIAIYSMDYKDINSTFSDSFNSSIINSLSKSSYFKTIDNLINGNKDALYFVNQFHSFDRQFTQQSVFLANCGFGFSTNQLLQGQAGINKYILRKSERTKVLKDLDKMNINGHSLFPGLDGFSRRIKIKNSY
jgi:hypothetical protein